MNKRYLTILSLCCAAAISAQVPADSVATGNAWLQQPIDIGGNVNFSREQSTGAVSIIGNDQIDRRSAKNIANDILGQGNGLISKQGAGIYQSQNPTFYVRGLQTLNDNNAPLILIDGIERDINQLSPEEVENVSILKDAVATALYGYKAINGAILITTKRGEKNTRSIKISYDHNFNQIAHMPKFVDAYTYGSAINEALGYEGAAPRYNSNELNAFKEGTYPYLYPNVNWVDETFRKKSSTNNYNIEFRGGTEKFRYYADLGLITDMGHIKNPNTNDGYSTQDKFTRGNLRMNLDIDLTPTTQVKVNAFGSIQECTRPGKEANLWDMVYSVPSAAMPIKAENGKWGGSNTWAGTINPVAQSEAAGYYRNHSRLLFTDLTIRQNLSGLTEGLSAQLRVAYDNIANIYEDHSKTYTYTVVTPSWPEGAAEPTFKSSNQGTDSELGTDADVNTFDRRLHFDFGVDYQRTFGDLAVYSQLKWDYEYQDPEGVNNTLYRQNISWWSHLGYKNRYFLDLTLAEMGSSRLAPHTKWAFSPTVGLAWVISNESFWSNPNAYLKLRATAGKLNGDFLPDDSWTYYAQQYTITGGVYPWMDNWSSDFGRTTFGRLATENPNHEKAYKYNIGIDASPIPGLNLTLDLWKERRSGIWCTTEGMYSALIGMEAPYENVGKVDSKGIEFSADYSKKFGDFTLDVAGNFTYNKSKILYMAEEQQPYANLVRTGDPVGQLYGLVAEGLFQSEAEIQSSPRQTFSTVRPGDIKYKDINGDNVIDANDKTKIGHSTTAPEIFYNFRLGLDYKGFGVYAFFQGTGNYSAVLNTKSMYWGLINNTTISQYAYDNRWTPQTPNAEFPRLSSESNPNNYQTSTFWLRNRSFLKLRNLEVYYNVPQQWLRSNLKVVNGCKLYVRAIDLFCASHMPQNDPEAYGVQPVDKSISIGASVTF